MFDRWIMRAAGKLAQKEKIKSAFADKKAGINSVRSMLDSNYPMTSKREVQDSDFSNDQSQSNTFILHKAINGHILEVWEENPMFRGSVVGNVEEPNKKQRLYLVPSGEDVIGAVATALVANKLDNR